MPDLSYGEINDRVLGATSPPGILYYGVLFLLSGGIGTMFLLWLYQILYGMGASNLHQPTDWGSYITNFVFWVGIGHSGTLISAILYLARAKWRDAVSRGAEAMTVFAVMIAGMFPMIHLGRVWVFQYLLPYPSQRQLWPNFISPLVWDVLAVSTYLTVSVIFFLVGLVPDAASARDRAEELHGRDSLRARAYRLLSLGWSGAGSQWRHYGRSYLFFAALATPLVISVHSIVSWDFAMALLKGWHSTLFAPYFVAGAIHSGLAMVLTLMIPLRAILGLEKIITDWHLEQIARTMLVTTAIVAYAYVVEPFIAWYSTEEVDRQFTLWRMTGWISPVWWSLILLNVLAPLSFAFKRVRTSPLLLFPVSLLVNLGMWLERYMIIVSGLSHDYMPHSWTLYVPNILEIGITAGSFAMFFFLYLLFAKTLPTVPMSDLKARVSGAELVDVPVCVPEWRTQRAEPGRPGVLFVYGTSEGLVRGLEQACREGFHRVETFSPVRLDQVEVRLAQGKSPVRLWTLAGALAGLTGGIGLAVYAALSYGIIVGGKHPVSLIPYMIVGFEGLILIGSLANLAGLVVHSRLFRLRTHPAYDSRFSRDRFGLLLEVAGEADADRAEFLLAPTRPEEVRHV